jgi:hypothetical protein
MKWPVVILLAILVSACADARKASEPNVPRETPQASIPSPTPTLSVNNGNAVSAAPADDGAEADADFEGTAGITEKPDRTTEGVAIMTDVRTARHTNFDRVVFEFRGPGLPGYHIEYIDKPVRACGSGNVVPLAGDGWLEVRFTAAHAHTDAGEPTVKDRERSPNLPVVKQLKLTCDFEAEVTWVAGVASPNRYRVIELKDPTRLAVDIKH